MKRIFISFDYDHDRNYRYLLAALKANPRNDLVFDDVTPQEIQSSDIGRVKAVLTSHIKSATHTLVVIGAHANTPHKDSAAIGERNWQWWEIRQSLAEQNRLVGVKIQASYTSPSLMLNVGASWALSFTVVGIIKAIDAV